LAVYYPLLERLRRRIAREVDAVPYTDAALGVPYTARDQRQAA
jgi:hypothetical protein